jgi:molybdopterin-guanine dinucleotide biosynthesis protein A
VVPTNLLAGFTWMAMNMMNGPLSVAVLAGGKSSRMRVDKALLPLFPEGPPLLQLVLDNVRGVASDLFIVARDRPQYEGFGVPVVPDFYEAAGTLGAIATAIAACAHDACLVVACDMPFLSPPLLSLLADHPRDYDVLIPRLPGESRQGSGHVYQTLHAIYTKRCLEPIERRLQEGNRQVIGFFDDVDVRVVDVKDVRSIDPELRSFFNANTPEAAAEARRIVERGARLAP